MGLPRIFGFCFTFLFAASVNANIIDLGPSDYKNYGPSGSHSSGGIKSSFGQTTRLPPRLNTLTVTRNALVPYGSAARGMSSFLRVTPTGAAASAAVTTMFLAMDWYFDQESGEWVKDDLLIDETIDSGLWIGTAGWLSSANGLNWSTKTAACTALLESHVHSSPWTLVDVVSEGGTWKCVGEKVGRYDKPRIGSVLNQSPGCPFSWEYSAEMGTCLKIDMTPVNLADMESLASQLPTMDPSVVAQGTGDAQRKVGGPFLGYQDLKMNGPETTEGPSSTSTTTTDDGTVVTETTTINNHSYGDTTITTSQTTTTTTYTNGVPTETTVTETEPGNEVITNPGAGTSSDWPAFCEWAPNLCGWLDWTQEPPPAEPDLPQAVDVDFYEEKDISFGVKSCPPDYQIDLSPFMQNTVGVSFQPFCDFAALIYFLVMAASYVAAAYITIGVARNG